MIADEERGSAWSRVVLGLPAREVHLCGNEAALNIIRRILSTTGDELEVKKYTCLSPLVPSKDSLGMYACTYVSCSLSLHHLGCLLSAVLCGVCVCVCVCAVCMNISKSTLH